MQVSDKSEMVGEIIGWFDMELPLIKFVIVNTSTLRLLALRGLRTLRVRTLAFGPRFGGKLPPLIHIEEFICLIVNNNRY